MSRTEIVNIVKKITQLSQRDKADLVRILEEALEGGGGDTSKLISVEPQDFTKVQQMQARKNQGLYYSEETPAGVITWDGDTTGKEVIEGEAGDYCKVSTDTPSKDSVKTFGRIRDGEESIVDIEVEDITSIDGGYTINDGIIIVITESEATIEGISISRGVWFRTEGGRFVSKLTYDAYETVQHIEPKYIKDMYYEETNEEEKTVFTPDDPNYEWQYPDNYFEFGTERFEWICEDTPAQKDIIKVKFTDSGTYIQGSELSSSLIEPEAVEGGPIVLYELNDSDSARKKFFVVLEDASLNGFLLKKGIYVPKLETYAAPYIREINYNGTTTTVHQIPQKYLPATGFQTYDINIDWVRIDEIIIQGYGYGWDVDNPEEEYNKLREALANGKMIALNISGGNFGYPGGKLLTGNYLPLNSENEDGFESEIVFPVIDWPSYNLNTGRITGSQSHIIRLKFGYGIETGEFKYEFVTNSNNEE